LKRKWGEKDLILEEQIKKAEEQLRLLREWYIKQGISTVWLSFKRSRKEFKDDG